LTKNVIEIDMLSDVVGVYTYVFGVYIRTVRNFNVCVQQFSLNLLTPNVNYSGHTAPLTSKVAFYIFIQQIQVLNILNIVYTIRFFLFKMQFVS